MHMEADWGVFVVNIKQHTLILVSYIDDCTVTDLRLISWLLGMKVSHNHAVHTISLSQEPYVNAILAKYNFAEAKLVSIPLDPHVQLSEKQLPRMTGEFVCMCNIPY